MTRRYVLVAFLLAGCGTRAAPTSWDGASSRERAVAAGDLPRISADLAEFCSGPPKVIINGARFAVKEVTAQEVMLQCCAEAAELKLIATDASGVQWAVWPTLRVGVTYTITDRPLPQTVSLEKPPPGFAASLHFRRPADCLGGCFTDLLWTESDRFSGTMTLRGASYTAPLELALCLQADDQGAKHSPDHEVHSLQIWVPAVTIPGWRVYP